MKTLLNLCVLGLLVQTTFSYPLKPFVTCHGCETFFQCIFLCPGKNYPGLNRQGIYDPPRPESRLGFGRRADDVPLEDPSEDPEDLYVHHYDNYKPYDPAKYRNYHKTMYLRGTQNALT